MNRPDLMQLLADARPGRLDPDPGTVPDPRAITAHPRNAAGRTTRRRLVLAGALPVTAALVVGALVLTNGGPPAGPGGAGPGATVASASARPDPQTARDLLLVAAEQSGTGGTGGTGGTENTATGGRYRVKAYEHGERKEVGPPSARYAVTTRTALQHWRATDPDDPSVDVHQYLGARPATAADEAAWRAAGSPDHWTEDAPPGMTPIERTAAAGPRQVLPMRGTAGRELALAGQPVTEAELAALPTDPSALRARLVAKRRDAGGQENVNYALFYAGRSLVTDLPVSAQVRAATYRMLADVPGIDLLGKVEDQGGRSGFAIAYTRRGDAGWGQIRLIIDPGAGTVLSEESWFLGADRSGATLMRWTLILRDGYTNDDPPAA